MVIYKEVYEIDEDGFLIESPPKEFDEEGLPIEELPDNFIVSDPPHNFHHARWDGEEWIEGLTPEEIEEITKPQPPVLTIEEQLAEKDAQILKLKQDQYATAQLAEENGATQQDLIELLMDMGVI